MNEELDIAARREKLRQYFSAKEDFRIFVGIPLADPAAWDEAFSLEGDHLCGADLRSYPIEETRSWLACYSTLEAVDGEGLFEPLPPGVSGIRPTDAAMPAFTAKDLIEGLRLVDIEFAESPTHPGKTTHYKTTLTNHSSEKIRCLAFGAYAREFDEFRLTNVTGQLYSPAQFDEWYGVRRGGWIEAGESVCDPTNYGSDCFWVYYFESKAGQMFHTGKYAKGASFWTRFKQAFKAQRSS